MDAQIHSTKKVHYDDVIMTTLASQITSLTVVDSDAYQRKHQSSASLAFVRGINRGPVNSPHKWPVTRKMFPFDDVIMYVQSIMAILRNILPCMDWQHGSFQDICSVLKCISPWNFNEIFRYFIETLSNVITLDVHNFWVEYTSKNLFVDIFTYTCPDLGRT